MQTIVNQKKLIIQVGDITKYNGDAIVNAANPYLAGGGGVDGAIHRAGGPSILKACQEIIREIKRLPNGKAVITAGGALPARNVIHAVGPIYSRNPRSAPDILKSAYLESLKLADKMALKDMAFPSIGTGSYGYPLAEAAAIAMDTIVHYLKGQTGLEKVAFYLFSNHDYAVYAKALKPLVDK